jgi:hypothetical protein
MKRIHIFLYGLKPICLLELRRLKEKLFGKIISEEIIN